MSGQLVLLLLLLRLRLLALLLAASTVPCAAAAPTLPDELHDEFSKAVARLFSSRLGLRSSVPPELINPFIQASRYSTELPKEALAPEPVWHEWREELRGELHAVADEMALPTPLRTLPRLPSESDSSYNHRNSFASHARNRVKEIYAEENSVQPTADHPLAVLVEDYPSLLRFVGTAEFRRNYFERRPLLLTRRQEQLRRVNGETEDHGGDGEWNNYEPLLDFKFGMANVTAAGEFVYGMPNTFWHHRNVKIARSGFHRFSETWKDNDRITAKEIGKALSSGATAFFNGASNWSPDIAALNLDLSVVFGHLTSVNLYVTAGGVSKSMSAHNDIQCTFIIQLEGRKRWRLWPKPSLLNALLSNDREIGDELMLGKNADTQMIPNQLGEPYLDVVLAPGDVLYVPRGVIHATSTLGERSSGGDRSSHLTAGIDAFHGLNTAAVLGGKMGWLSHTKNHSFLHEYLPHHLDLSRYPYATGPAAKAAMLKQAFDSMLGVAGADGAETSRFPPSAEAAAARCESADQSEEGADHFLVDVLCELGQGMHAWQAMAGEFSDKSKHPSRKEWADSVQYNGGADPRKQPWQPEQAPRSDFEKALEAIGTPVVAAGSGSGGRSPLGSAWDHGRRAEITWAMSHDFWSDTKAMANFLPELQATITEPETDAEPGASKPSEPQTADEKKQAAYEALMARRAKENAGGRDGKPKKERKKRVRKKVIEEEYEDDEEGEEGSSKQEL